MTHTQNNQQQWNGWTINSVLVTSLALMLVCAYSYWRLNAASLSNAAHTQPDSSGNITSGTISTNSTVDSSKKYSAPTTVSLNESDEKLTELALGKWTSKHYGLRNLELKSGGVAVMHYTPEGMATILVGSLPVTVNINWKVVQGVATFTLVDGDPQSEVDAMIRLNGKHQAQKIIYQDGKTFKLLDPDGVTVYEWHKIEP